MKNSVSKKSLRTKKIWLGKLGKSQIDSLVKNQPNPFAVFNFDGYILDINPAFEEIYGWKKKEIMQKYLPTIPPRLTGEFLAFLNKIRIDEKISNYEITRICKDRSEITVSIDAFLLTSQDGEPIAIGEISRDVTQIKREENITKKSQERWRTLARNVPYLIIIVDKQGKITFVNQRIKQLLGYDVEEIMNSSLSTLIADEDLKAVERDLMEVTTKDRMKSCIYQLKGKDDSTAVYAINWSSLKGSSGKIEGAVGIGRDITREKEIETELIQSQRLQALAGLVGGIAHHFNNLITVILMQAHLIGQDTKELRNETIKKRLESIKESCLQGKKKVEQSLEFVEGLSAKQFLMVDINQVIKQALSDVLVQLKAKAIQVNTRWGNIPSILGCFFELRRGLGEIFINAVEAMSQGGNLDIKTEMEKNLVYISITDSGIGMSEEVQKKMFEPFFTTKEPTRSGLGAALAYGIFKKHGGKIKVLSAPKKGTTIVIKLPTKQMPKYREENKYSSCFG